MKKFFHIIAIFCLLTAASSSGYAQEEESDSSDASSFSSIFGDGNFEVKADGSIVLQQGSEGIKSMLARDNVRVDGEDLSLECDNLEVDMEEQLMIAKGKPVSFSQEDIKGLCDRLTYNLDTKKMVLEGKSKPLIRQAASDGRITETRADKITIVQLEDGGSNILLDGKPEIKVVGQEGAAGDKDKKKKPAKKIDDEEVDSIANRSVGIDG